MAKHKKRGKRKIKNSSRSQPLASPSMRRNKWILVGAAIICAAVSGFFYLRSLLPTHEEQQTKQPDSNSTELSSPGPANSILTPEQEVAALKKEAINAAIQLTNDFPNDAEAFFLSGSIYRNQGNSEKAIMCWERCVELDSNHTKAYHGMAEIAFDKGEYERAVDLGQRILDIDPKLPGVYNSLACALMCMGKAEEAVKAFQKDIEISGQSIHSQFMLGKQYQLLKEYEKAGKCYETVIKMAPGYTQAYYGLATICAMLGEKENSKRFMETFRKLKDQEMKALKEQDSRFNDLVSARKTVAQAHTDVGQLYYLRRSTEKAEKLLKRAAMLDSKQSDCRVLLATLYEQDGKLMKALHFYEQLTSIQPHSINCHANVGVLSLQLQRYDDAEKAFRKVIELDPNQSFGYYHLAYLYLKTNRKLPEAEKLAEKAVALEKTGENFFILSWACNVNGDRASAMSAIQQAIEFEPGNIEYRQMYEQLKRGN
ncbi:MAG: tetratricopeptide repeat protein [Planctomycetota bacterium]|jgi:tetratricopeptide (TPR) repeat protein